MMKSKLFITLYFVVAFSLVIAWTNMAREHDSTKRTVIRDGHKQTLAVVNPQVILPQYKTADLLQEDLGGSIVDLLPSNISTNDLFRSFSILNEGGTYFLWLNTSMEPTVPSPPILPSVEQRFESTDGLIWRNRTDTDLVKNQSFKFTSGLRGIFNNGGTYQGWEQYYYEVSSGWGFALRYVTSNNGINWTVVNDPALIGTRYFSIITDGVTYQMWGHPNGDGNYTGSRALRYRTNNNPGTGWGNWQTGGTLVNLNGVGNNLTTWTRVRQGAGGTYELFYIQPSLHLNKAISNDGINFTTVITDMIDFNAVMPTILNNRLSDFEVVDIGGEDWIYFTYCEAMNTLFRCTDTNIAVSRPVYAEIDVLDGAVSIPDDTGVVNFSTTLVSAPITKIFTVRNSGEGDLIVTPPITLPVGYSVVNSFGTTTVLSGTSTTFEIQLDASTAGVFNGTLAFDNNDLDENPYNFIISGTVLAATPGYSSIPNVGSTIDVGTTVVSNTTNANLMVHETGTATLDVGVPGGGLLSGANAADFAIVNGPPFSISDGGADHIVTIQCMPSGVGVRTATLSFTTNDPIQPTVSYTLNCTGTTAPSPAPPTNNDDDDDDDDDGGGVPAPPSAIEQVVDCWPWQVIVPTLAVPGAKVQCLPMLGDALPAASTFRYLDHSVEITVSDASGTPVSQFNLPLKVCFHYTQVELDVVGGEMTNFHLQTYREGVWESLDTIPEGTPSGAVLGRVCALVDHLTLFALFDGSTGKNTLADSPVPEVKYLPETGLPPIYSWFRIIGGILMVLITLVIAFGMLRGQRR